MTKVLGMGNALVDVLAVIEDDNMLQTLGLPKGSMQLIDDEKFEILSNELSKLKTSIVSGGSASNTIVGLARLGVNCGFTGRIGQDFYGDYYKKDLEENGVKPHLSEGTEKSGVASTFISKDGERTFGTYLGAAALLSAEHLNEKDFEGYDYFYIEGYLVQNHDLIKRAVSLAKNAGAKVILDLASYNVVEENREFLMSIIPYYANIIFANEEEAKSLFGLPVEEAIDKLAQYCDIAVIKTGEKGSWLKRGIEKVFVPALKVNCIDSTGAGDLYAAGFIYGLMNNFSLYKSGEIGTLLAGKVIQNIGAKIKEENWPALIEIVESLNKD